MNFGTSIKRLRDKKEWSQRAAAKVLGITPVHLCNLEADKSWPSRQMVETVERVYGVQMRFMVLEDV